MTTFSVVDDPSVAASGIDATILDQARTGIVTAGNIINRYFEQSNVDIEILFRVAELTGIATGGTSFHFSGVEGPGQEVWQLNALTELVTGAEFDPGSGTVDITMTFDPDFLDGQFYFETDPVNRTGTQPFGQYDFLTVAIHEILHGLGFLAIVAGEPSGFEHPTVIPDITPFDDNVDLIAGDRFFNGPNTQAANGGSGVLLLGGTSSHLEPASAGGIDSIMNPSLSNGVKSFLTPIEIAMLQDMGVALRTATGGADELWGYINRADTLSGLGGDDTLIGLSGNDTLDGGLGFDKAGYSGSARSASTLTRNIDGSWTVNGPEGTDTLTGIEFLDFSDLDVWLEAEALTLSSKSVASYAGVQDQGTATVSGNEVTLANNAWKRIEINKTIAANTVLAFDFKSDTEGEVHGIGFDNDQVLSQETLFQLDGSEAFGLQGFASGYTTGSGYQHYEIPVGTFFTGEFANLILAMDDDGGAGGDSTFRNISLFEQSGLLVDGMSFPVESYGGPTQDFGTASISPDGTQATLTDNAWKKVALNTTITANTILAFDFKSDIEGEVHAIGFDIDDDIFSTNTLFQLDGSQAFGQQAFAGQYTTGSGFRHYEIPVGNFFTGSFDRLVFAMDDDAGIGADSTFANITLFEPPNLTVDGASLAVQSYGGPTQDFGSVSVSPDGTEATLTNNAWKKVALNKTITADTILSFDFKSDVEGEVHGIGLDNDNDIFSTNTLFQLDGNQAFGQQAFAGQYTSGTGFRHYEITVGDFFTGAFDRLVFAMDDDAGLGGDSTFANIEFLDGTIMRADNRSREVESYGGPSQDLGIATVSADLTSVTLTDNAWKKLAVNTTIDANTILSFDFMSNTEGEVHGIGFDTDNTLSAGTLFQLDGTQLFGQQNTAGQYATGSGFQHYEINVGSVFTGDFENLVLAMDDDAGVGADSTFRNIEILQAPLPSVGSYGGAGQDFGRAFGFDNDNTLKLDKNAWKKIDTGALEIDGNTVLSFDFKSNTEGEVHGIGFDTDDALSAGTLFQLDGTQIFGQQNTANQYTTGSGYRHYDINVGSVFTGTFDRLVLAMDDDTSVGADSYFSNIVLTGLGASDDTLAVYPAL